MLRRRGEALSRGQLLEGAWELGFESRSNLVDVYVRYLRDKKGDEVALHVLDSGPGLPEHFAARALDRFSRADGARSAVGAGLGLAIVDLIARGHGGRVEVRARDGGGSDVAIVLSRSVNAPAAVHAEPRQLLRRT